MKKAIILDTSVLCIWLQVPGKETCGSGESKLTYENVNNYINAEISNEATLILPLASIIETGNHITQTHGDKFSIIKKFVNIIEASLKADSPWAAFSQQSELFEEKNLKEILKIWESTALAGQSLGDAMIVEVAKLYASYNIPVEIYTCDAGLKSYEPAIKSEFTPRRRK